MIENAMKRGVAGLSLAAAAVSGAGVANAASSSQSFNVPYGKLYVSAWECNTYATSCSWYTKAQLQKSSKMMDRITNTTQIYANGISAKVTISKNQASATLSGNRTSMAKVSWTKWKSNLVELSGQARPSWTTVGITTKACISGDGPGRYGAVSSKCTQIGLW